VTAAAPAAAAKAPVPPWRRVLDRYLESLAVERGLARNTVEGYRNDLSRLGEALAKKGGSDLLAATSADLSAHMRDLQRQGLSPRSSARALSAIRGFYDSLPTNGASADVVTLRALGNEVAFYWALTIDLGESKMRIDIISVMTFGEDGKIASMKAYWTPENVTQL